MILSLVTLWVGLWLGYVLGRWAAGHQLREYDLEQQHLEAEHFAQALIAAFGQPPDEPMPQSSIGIYVNPSHSNTIYGNTIKWNDVEKN